MLVLRKTIALPTPVCYSSREMKQAAGHSTTGTRGGRQGHSAKTPKQDPRQQFVAAAVTMSWQLAIVILVPVFIGVQLDKKFGTHFVCTFVGLGVALLGSGVVMWRALQVANRIPVPKLTDKQKRDIKKSYEEDDKDA